MHKALENNVTSEAYAGAWKALATAKGIDPEQLQTSSAYKIRVMLAHARIKRQAFVKSKSAGHDIDPEIHPPGLQKVYEALSPEAHTTAVGTRVLVNPFPFFRQHGAEEEELSRNLVF